MSQFTDEQKKLLFGWGAIPPAEFDRKITEAAKGQNIDDFCKQIVGMTWSDLHEAMPAWRKAYLNAEYSATKDIKDSTATPKTLVFEDISEAKYDPQAHPALVEGLIFQRASQSLMGKPKMGKTTLMLEAIEAVLSHRDFLKRKTTPVSVVYLTEQYRESFLAECNDAGLLEKATHDERMRFVTAEQLFKLSYADIVQLTLEEAQRVNAQFVVFDTFSRIARVADENDAAKVQAQVDILTPLAEAGLGILLGQHERKSGGDIYDAGRGSNALFGAIDQGLRLTLPGLGNHPPYRRILECVGRLSGQTEPMVIERPDGSGYKYVGAADVAAAIAAEQKIIDLWLDDREAWFSERDIQSYSALPRSTVHRALGKLLKEGLVESRSADAKPKPGKPRLEFRLKPVVSF